MSQQRLNADDNRIVFLDYLRIFAFTSVIVGHTFYEGAVAFTQNTAIHATPRFILDLLLPLFYGGGAGVIVFFLVSGYIITHVLQTERTGEFVIKRIFRIYPLYMIAVLAQNSPNFILDFQYRHLLFEHRDVLFSQLQNLLSQLLLVGDFFETPYALGGVEWTLRLEVIFYVFMALLHSLKLMHTHKKLFPYVLVATTIALPFTPYFPSWSFYNTGYLAVYAPFFFLGAMFYLAEKKQIHLLFLICFTLLVFYQYFTLIALLHTRWLGAHFAALAVLIFTLVWAFRKNIVSNRWVSFASSLTYASYLLHAWLFDEIYKVITKNPIPIVNADFLTLVILLFICSLAVRYIEKPGIRLGQMILNKSRR